MWVELNDRKVVVTGIGVITSNGKDKYEFFENCKSGASGLKKCSLFDTSKFNTEYVGEIEKEYPYLPDKADSKSRVDYIVEDCLDEMMKDANLTKEDISAMGDRAYFSFATSLASVEKMMQFVKNRHKDITDLEWLLQIPKLVPRIKALTGVEGSCYTTTTACTSSTSAVGIAFDLIKTGKADLVIVGGVDALNEFSFYGFNSLRALSKHKCKPFDNQRDGINIGEGGAFLVLESLERVKRRNAKIYAEILGYGINNDAYNITSPDPNGEGAFLSMEMALNEGQKSPQNIDYINAHGTGTVLNDSMETKAIDRIFEHVDVKIPVSSTKSLIGHCLAAAGILEVVVTIFSIDENICVKNIRLNDKISDCRNINLIADNENKKINYALSNNFAFSGNTASVLIGHYEN